jgi:pyruvate kinase
MVTEATAVLASLATAPVTAPVTPFQATPDWLGTTSVTVRAYCVDIREPLPAPVYVTSTQDGKTVKTVKKDADGKTVYSKTEKVNTDTMHRMIAGILERLPSASVKTVNGETITDYSAGSRVTVTWRTNGQYVTFPMRIASFHRSLVKKATHGTAVFAVKQADGTYREYALMIGNIARIEGEK